MLQARIGYGERLLPRTDFTLCEHFVLIGSGMIWNIYFGIFALLLGFFLATALAVAKMSPRRALRKPAEWFIFAGLSLFFMFTFRKTLYDKLRLSAGGYTATISGDTVDIDVQLNPGDETRASYRGSEWTVRNTGENVIEAGTRVHVVRVDGVKLHVE